jgi:hypothetical protein
MEAITKGCTTGDTGGRRWYSNGVPDEQRRLTGEPATKQIHCFAERGGTERAWPCGLAAGNRQAKGKETKKMEYEK